MKRKISPIGLARKCASIAESKKAGKIMIYDVRRMTPFYDYCLVCSGNSNVHVASISEEIIGELKKSEGLLPMHREGLRVAQWVLLDYSSVLVHVFREETRKYYSIEELWQRAKVVEQEKAEKK